MKTRWLAVWLSICGISVAAPKLEWLTPLEQDGGTLDGIGAVIHEVRFWNSGTAPLEIARLRTTCSCSAVMDMAQRTYAPGETGSFNVVADLRREQGPRKFIVFVESNDPAAPVTMWSVVYDVIPPLELEPLSANFAITNTLELSASITTRGAASGMAVRVGAAFVRPLGARVPPPLRKEAADLISWKLTRGGDPGTHVVTIRRRPDAVFAAPVLLNLSVEAGIYERTLAVPMPHRPVSCVSIEPLTVKFLPDTPVTQTVMVITHDVCATADVSIVDFHQAQLLPPPGENALHARELVAWKRARVDGPTNVYSIWRTQALLLDADDGAVALVVRAGEIEQPLHILFPYKQQYDVTRLVSVPAMGMTQSIVQTHGSVPAALYISNRWQRVVDLGPAE